MNNLATIKNELERTVYVTMEPSKDKPGFYSPTGFHLEEPTNWVYAYRVCDPNDFIKHMQVYASIPKRKLNRDEYEKICEKFNIPSMTNEELLTHSDSLEFGDFGMDHYHIDPQNRNFGIANTIHQNRYLALKKEIPEEKIETKEYPLRKEGQLFESCEKCGAEPVYMPLHLCDKCWPR